MALNGFDDPVHVFGSGRLSVHYPVPVKNLLVRCRHQEVERERYDSGYSWS